jgi:RES domain-containing protein
MELYRICNSLYSKDISGSGAAMYGGRWNSKGIKAVYLSSHISLALLEILVNYNYAQLQEIAFDIITLDVPSEKLIETIPSLEEKWQYFPKYTKSIGDYFLLNSKRLSLKIPSAIIEKEYNYMLNPMREDFKKIKILNIDNFTLDNRLIKKV